MFISKFHAALGFSVLLLGTPLMGGREKAREEAKRQVSKI
jgi:hypothetical protein